MDDRIAIAEGKKFAEALAWIEDATRLLAEDNDRAARAALALYDEIAAIDAADDGD